MKLRLLNVASTFTELHLINSYGIAFYKMQLWVWYKLKKKETSIGQKNLSITKKP